MFKRKITKEFINWKNDGGKKKALVIKGMRQIGKVSTATHLAMLRYFQEYICVGGLPYIVDRFLKPII